MASFNEFNELFSRGFSDLILNSIPRESKGGTNSIHLDIINDENKIEIYAELPGVNKGDIELDFFNNKMTIKARKIRPYPPGTVSEISYGELSRVVTLPICITRKETVTTEWSNGVLKIKINKLIEEENRFSVSVE